MKSHSAAFARRQRQKAHRCVRMYGLIHLSVVYSFANAIFCQVIKWRFEDIRDVRKRRYLLQERALEIFSLDGNNHMITFDSAAKRDTVFSLIVAKSALSAEGSSENSEIASSTKVCFTIAWVTLFKS